MLKQKEIISLVLALIVLAFSNSFLNQKVFIYSLVFFAIILSVYITGKKLLAYYLESKSEEKIWSFQRYWFSESSHFKTPIPVGLILPFLLSVVSLGYIKWFAVTETDIVPAPARAVRRHDFYSYSELTEWHVALISSVGIIFVMLLSFIAYLINQPELAKLSIYFSIFNMLPIGSLDGSRIFFGSRILYFTLLAIVLIALGAVFLIV